MEERLYTTHADCYDALYRELKDYEDEVTFILDQFKANSQTEGTRVLILGCGTGEHAKRLVAHGFDVLGIDKYEEMLAIASQKSDATFQVGTIPDIEVDRSFDLILLPFTVINHLEPDELEPTLQNTDQMLADGGVLIFDNGAFPAPDDDAPPPGLAVHATDIGDIARLTQVQPQDETRVRWNSVVFIQDRGEFFIDTHDLTPFEDTEIKALLHDLGFAVNTYVGYGAGGQNTVFVAY